jgi:hypothetical protein
LVEAGDIGDCNLPGSDATARLLDRISGTVFTAGDNAYRPARMTIATAINALRREIRHS